MSYGCCGVVLWVPNTEGHSCATEGFGCCGSCCNIGEGTSQVPSSASIFRREAGMATPVEPSVLVLAIWVSVSGSKGQRRVEV